MKTSRSTWTRSLKARCVVMNFVCWSKHFPLISSLASNRYVCWPSFFSRFFHPYAPWRSSKRQNGVTVTTGFATGDIIPAWTTQRAACNCWVNCCLSPGSPPWTPAADSGGLLSTFNKITIFLETMCSAWIRSFQVRCEVVKFSLCDLVG